MLVVGALKYGERVWALKCANANAGNDDNSRLVRGMDVIPGQRKSRRARGQSSDGDAEGLLATGSSPTVRHLQALDKGAGRGRSISRRPAVRRGSEEMFKLIEMQLSLI